jgi:hypothetical protein
MARKLNTQNRLDSSVAAMPSAASGAEPRRATKTVSTRPVSGSANSDASTGTKRTTNVRWGRRTKA